MKEIWKDIEGYNGKYQISNLGNIKSLYLKRNRKLGKDKDGYLKIELYNKGKYKSIKVHRLVALHFIPNPLNLPEINHKDGNIKNNRIDNLEWCTSSFNSRHRIYILNKNSLYPCKPVQCVETGKVYPSISEAARIHNVVQASLSRVLNNKKFTCCGFHWKLV